MAGAYAGAVVAMEIFVKRNEITPMGIGLKPFGAAEYRPAAMLIAEKYAGEPLRYLTGDIPEGHELTGARRALEFVFVAEIKMKFLQRFDNQVIHRKPNGPAPVRIAAE